MSACDDLRVSIYHYSYIQDSSTLSSLFDTSKQELFLSRSNYLSFTFFEWYNDTLNAFDCCLNYVYCNWHMNILIKADFYLPWNQVVWKLLTRFVFGKHLPGSQFSLESTRFMLSNDIWSFMATCLPLDQQHYVG